MQNLPRTGLMPAAVLAPGISSPTHGCGTGAPAASHLIRPNLVVSKLGQQRSRCGHLAWMGQPQRCAGMSYARMPSSFLEHEEHFRANSQSDTRGIQDTFSSCFSLWGLARSGDTRAGGSRPTRSSPTGLGKRQLPAEPTPGGRTSHRKRENV